MGELGTPERRKAPQAARPLSPAMANKVDIFETIVGPGRSTQKNRELFESRLSEMLEPTLSAKELIEKIVTAALEIEFGPTFTLSKGFAKMVSTIADAIVTNPELRRQALAVASHFISRKMGPREHGGI
jgi:hypothetical protein